jgi:hypothetical protein
LPTPIDAGFIGIGEVFEEADLWISANDFTALATGAPGIPPILGAAIGLETGGADGIAPPGGLAIGTSALLNSLRSVPPPVFIFFDF